MFQNPTLLLYFKEIVWYLYVSFNKIYVTLWLLFFYALIFAYLSALFGYTSFLNNLLNRLNKLILIGFAITILVLISLSVIASCNCIPVWILQSF